jgi:hypothetical protein
MSNHLWLDFDFNEMLSVVNGDAATDELWKDWHVSAVRTHGTATRSVHASKEMLVFHRHSTAHAATGSGWQKTNDVVFAVFIRPEGHGFELFKIESTVGEFFLDSC